MNRPREPQGIERRLARARSRLILDHPFLGALVLHLPLVEAQGTWCSGFATDARAIYYNPDYVARLSVDETAFLLGHETLHCALGHFARGAHRLVHRWNVACDYAVNALLVDAGLTPPAGILYRADWANQSAEAIYHLLPNDPAESPIDHHAFEGGTPRPVPASEEAGTSGDMLTRGKASGAEDTGREAASDPSEAPVSGPSSRDAAGTPPAVDPGTAAALRRQWAQRAAAAARNARGHARSDRLLRRLGETGLVPQVPWPDVLAHYLTRVARDRHSFRRPTRREGPAILPRLAHERTELEVVLDTSGSIGTAEMGRFLAELEALMRLLPAQVRLHGCDDRLSDQGPWTFEPGQRLEPPERIRGGGATDFRPVFRWIAQHRAEPDALVYFTDAQGIFPDEPPDYPVLWLVKGPGAVPWGVRIPLN